MCVLKNYKVARENSWTGRIDDPEDPSSYRWHQVIEFVDVAEVSPQFDQDNRTAKLMAIIIFSIINTCMNREVGQDT